MVELSNPFFLTLSLGVVTVAFVYYMFGNHGTREPSPTPPPPPPKYERLPVGKMTKEEIGKFTGEDGGRILTSICGRIFDFSAGRDFYGPGGPYSCFIGGDASFMLGAMSLKDEDRNKTKFEVDDDIQMTLSDWLGRFRQKYPIVGRLEGFETLCVESWIESGVDDANVTDNENVVNGTSKNSKIESMSLTDLSGCGNDVVSVSGFVFNVQGAEFVYAPFYGDFAGAIRHDISLALALNDFSEDNLNQPLSSIYRNSNGDNESEVEARKERLLARFKAFCETYPIVGKISDEGFSMARDNDGKWQIIGQNDSQDKSQIREADPKL